MDITNRSTLLVLLAGLLVLTGCRTYGDYGSTAATIDQAAQAAQDYADALNRARADLDRLQAAAESNTALAMFVPRYEHTIAQHEAQLSDHRAITERLQDDPSYRTASRLFGAMISEQRATADRYHQLHKRIQQTVQGVPGAMYRSAESPSYVVPTYYKRVENQGRLSMRQALQP